MRTIKLVVSTFFFLSCIGASGQKIVHIGGQFGTHATFARIKYIDLSEWEPAALHVNLLGNFPFRNRFSFQMEIGAGERRTVYRSSGVSHFDLRRYRLLQLECSVLGKYRLNAGVFGLYGLAGLSAGIALAGSEYAKGGAAGPVSWEKTGPVDFDFFPYRRLSWGPTLGFNIQHPLGPGEFVLYTRVNSATEKYCPGCGNVLEVRLMAGIGYYWYLNR